MRVDGASWMIISVHTYLSYFVFRNCDKKLSFSFVLFINNPLTLYISVFMCAGMFNSEVQFGHAGACANAERETAVAKNKALSESGANVPSSFDELGVVSVVAC